MTQELIERFRDVLEPFEKERLKIVHNRKGFLFVVYLVAFLAFLLLIAGFIGSSSGVVVFSIFMFIASCALFRARSKMGSGLRARLRQALVRDWFHAAYPGVFLGAPPSEIPLEVSRSLREACIRATAQAPSRTTIEERVFFETDTYHSWAFILRERSLLGGVKSRAIVWFRAASFDQALVAFAWPSLGLSKAPDVRFFVNGKPVDAQEPLRSKLVAVYDRLRAKADGRAVRVSVSPNGVWAGVRLEGRLFEAPPITKSFLEASSYESWAQEARLPVDREIAPLLASI